MPQPFVAQFEQIVAHFAFQQDLAHQHIQRHGTEYKIIQGFIGQQRDLVQGAVPSHEEKPHKEKHSYQTARSQGKAYRQAGSQKYQQHHGEQNNHFATSPAAAAGS